MEDTTKNFHRQWSLKTPDLQPYLGAYSYGNPLLGSSTWHFHVKKFVALNYGSQKSTFTILDVVNFPAYIYHVVVDEFFCLSF